jgi:cell division protein FtsQ
MWFNRKARNRNRRLGREQVLDVKLRSSKVRAARARMAAMSLAAVFGTVLGLFLLWRGGHWALNQLVYENQSFAIREIDAQTDGIIARDQLRRWTGVKTGQNLLALDLAQVKRNLELVPAIQTASLERILPHTLRIRVAEREPLAQVSVLRPLTNGGVEIITFQMDANGYVFAPLEPRQRAGPPGPPEELPALLGINAGDVQPGRRIDSPSVQAALQLLSVFERSAMCGLVEMKRVDVSTPEALTATTSQGSEVTFGLSDFESQMRRWQAIFESGQRLGKAIGKLDLVITNNLPVCWLEGPAPALSPRPPKPLHSRKNHV